MIHSKSTVYTSHMLLPQQFRLDNQETEYQLFKVLLV